MVTVKCKDCTHSEISLKRGAQPDYGDRKQGMKIYCKKLDEHKLPHAKRFCEYYDKKKAIKSMHDSNEETTP